VLGRELRTVQQGKTQYFAVVFPDFVQGNVVEYLPVLSCVGRQVPAPQHAQRLASKFQLGPQERVDVKSSAPAPRPSTTDLRHFSAGLDFVAKVRLKFEPLQYVTDTADGMRVNLFVEEGAVEGKGFEGKVLEHSSDQLVVRPDGMGDVRIRGAFVLSDGARLDIEAGGYVDFGSDGYRRALAHDLPDRSPVVLTPLIHTRHPRYRWLSRIQCVGVGYSNLQALRLEYSVYAASSHPAK
jgi:hypothetical protein